jgi:hypothetical protein
VSIKTSLRTPIKNSIASLSFSLFWYAPTKIAIAAATAPIMRRRGPVAIPVAVERSINPSLRARSGVSS